MPGEDTSTPEFWLGRTHPDDQKRVRELFDRSITQKTDFDADYRIVLPDEPSSISILSGILA